jgi:hypothetical protein
MHPAAYPLSLYHGDTYRWRFSLYSDSGGTIPVDLTGVTAKAQIRKTPGDVSGVVADMTCTVTVPNQIDMLLPASGWSDAVKIAYWDLQLKYASGDILTILAGQVQIVLDVTI